MSDSGDPSTSTTVVHFYRAVVGHADVWRQRMDATTNWAAATTAAMITFSFGNDSPHFVLLIALAFDTVFLMMEARRYRTYHLWRRRFHQLNHYLIAPALTGGAEPPTEEIRDQFADLAADLGRTVPRISMLEAMGFRIYRNYGYLFGIVLFAWVLKLNVHPESADTVWDLVERAQIGGVPGATVMTVITGFFLIALVLAARAPAETMMDWRATPSLFGRWKRRLRRDRELGDEPLDGVDS